MKFFFRIFTILTRKQMFVCTFIIALMVLCAAMEAVGIGLVYPLIKIIGQPDFLQSHAQVAQILGRVGVDSHRRLIFFCSISLLAFYVFKNFVILLEAKIQIRFSMNNQKDYTRRLYAQYMSKPYLYHVNTNPAKLMQNINVGAVVVFTVILVETLSVITNLITILVIWLFLCKMDYVTALGCALVLAPFVFALLNHFRKRIGQSGSIQKAYGEEMNKWVNQGLGSLKETKVMQREGFFASQFDIAFTKYTESNKDYLFVQRLPKSIIELTMVGGILLLIAVKMFLRFDPGSLIANLGVLALAAVRIMPALNNAVTMLNDIKFRMPLFDEIYDDLLAVKKSKSQEDQKANSLAKEPLAFENQIFVKNLSFAYPGQAQKLVLDNVSFKIPKGSFCGIIGPSGAGKTTFVDILMGLLPPSGGTIYVDQKDIFNNISGWLDNIAYVPQSIYLMDASIRENIAFGHAAQDIDDKKIERVLKMADLHDFVQSLPEGLDSNVGDRGAKLSGGQRQRIGIARALYNQPSVLVLDEATSALDNDTERQITDTILKLKGKITIIAIAHRLSTLQECDFKIKFEAGKAQIV
ncbi:MAG: ABC transporter ATP-binding protein [Treponema sp.]|nr:ABC transporter ATP-binding protein [Treponema sp.]